MSTHFSRGFKEQAAQKAMKRGSVSLKAVAYDLSVGYSTLQKWIRNYSKVKHHTDRSRRPQDWKTKERFQALMDTAAYNAKQNLKKPSTTVLKRPIADVEISRKRTFKVTVLQSQIRALTPL